MKTSQFLAVALTASVAFAAPAMAQTPEVGANPYGGLHWSVQAPEGAGWIVQCRFTPVTIRGQKMNSINHTGAGAMSGRLPGDNGSCRVTKTGGKGGVGVAVVKNGEAKSAGTNNETTPATVNVF
jgi:hypothetical protein